MMLRTTCLPLAKTLLGGSLRYIFNVMGSDPATAPCARCRCQHVPEWQEGLGDDQRFDNIKDRILDLSEEDVCGER
jgi:hypothetical protein